VLHASRQANPSDGHTVAETVCRGGGPPPEQGRDAVQDARKAAPARVEDAYLEVFDAARVEREYVAAAPRQLELPLGSGADDLVPRPPRRRIRTQDQPPTVRQQAHHAEVPGVFGLARCVALGPGGVVPCVAAAARFTDSVRWR